MQIAGTRLPQAYVDFIFEVGSSVIDGYALHGLPTAESPVSVVEATFVLRKCRPDLPEDLIPIAFNGKRALCLVSDRDEPDPQLAEVDLTGKTFPEARPLGRSFTQWRHAHAETAARFQVAWNRVRARQAETRHGRAATQWTAVIDRVADYVVGLAAFRLNEGHGALEIDEFFPIDQPHIQPGEALKTLLNEVFARARDYTGSLNLIFTWDPREDADGKILDAQAEARARRLPSVIPPSIRQFAERHSIKFTEDGKVNHEEALQLWLALSGLSPTTLRRIAESEQAGFIGRDIVAEVISTDVWSNTEVDWLFDNASRPEGVVVGSDVPEDRLYYLDSLNWGRAVILARRFRQAVLADLTQGQSTEELEGREEYCSLTPSGEMWKLQSNKSFRLPDTWFLDQSSGTVEILADTSLTILSRPQWPTRLDADMSCVGRWVQRLQLQAASPNALLLSYEFRTRQDYAVALSPIVKAAARRGVHVLCAPTRMETFLDRDIERRMKRARGFRRFPPREGQLALTVFGLAPVRALPDQMLWLRVQEAMGDARTFATRIREARDVGHSRQEYSLSCDLIERTAAEYGNSIANVTGSDSSELIGAMRGSDSPRIMFPFVDGTDISPALAAALPNGTDQSAGCVVVPNPWSRFEAAPPRRARRLAPVAIPNELSSPGKSPRTYISRHEQVGNAREAILDAVRTGSPLGTAAFRSDALIVSPAT
jgi:hypothetical protein